MTLIGGRLALVATFFKPENGSVSKPIYSLSGGGADPSVELETLSSQGDILLLLLNPATGQKDAPPRVTGTRRRDHISVYKLLGGRGTVF